MTSLSVFAAPKFRSLVSTAKDVVRKLVSGDLDLGIVGLDTVYEYGQVSSEYQE